jgi:hypothetical protein
MSTQELIKKVELKITELIQENKLLKEQNQELKTKNEQQKQKIDEMSEEREMMELELEDILEKILSYSQKAEQTN